MFNLFIIITNIPDRKIFYWYIILKYGGIFKHCNSGPLRLNSCILRTLIYFCKINDIYRKEHIFISKGRTGIFVCKLCKCDRDQMYTYSEKRSLNTTVVNKKRIFEYIVFQGFIVPGYQIVSKLQNIGFINWYLCYTKEILFFFNQVWIYHEYDIIIINIYLLLRFCCNTTTFIMSKDRV